MKLLKRLFKKKKKLSEFPPMIREYEETLRSISPKNKVAQTKFLVFDIEGTSVDTKKGKILSVGGFLIQDMKIDIKSSFHWMVRQRETGAEVIHEILPSDSKEGMNIRDMLILFLQKASGAVMVGHCLRYDLEMINQVLYQEFQYTIKHPYIDTISMANRLYTKKDIYGNLHNKTYSLSNLCQRLGIDIKSQHDALEDAYATSLVFLKMAYTLGEQRSLRDFFRL